jgi:hypothetical protein
LDAAEELFLFYLMTYEDLKWQFRGRLEVEDTDK